MPFPSADCPVSERSSRTWLVYWRATFTSRAAARACSPSRLATTTWRVSMDSALFLRCQDIACQVDVLLSLIANALRERGQVVIRLLVGEADDHWQVRAGNDLDGSLGAEKRRGDIGGCSAEHVGQNENAAPA